MRSAALKSSQEVYIPLQLQNNRICVGDSRTLGGGCSCQTREQASCHRNQGPSLCQEIKPHSLSRPRHRISPKYITKLLFYFLPSRNGYTYSIPIDTSNDPDLVPTLIPTLLIYPFQTHAHHVRLDEHFIFFPFLDISHPDFVPSVL
ncbi:unnamed protein product [Cyclocybe aegerita]|uniref:Uncharacterized protein n=1 Tax=Cyclocybe aegerita TaxID=1973307 RepID=A0A8S0WNR9_CYCAE|nr:unnamed protein product [Cyclocybe aegerita]